MKNSTLKPLTVSPDMFKGKQISSWLTHLCLLIIPPPCGQTMHILCFLRKGSWLNIPSLALVLHDLTFFFLFFFLVASLSFSSILQYFLLERLKSRNKFNRQIFSKIKNSKLSFSQEIQQYLIFWKSGVRIRSYMYKCNSKFDLLVALKHLVQI